MFSNARTKQFNWYFKKQHTLNFQGRKGPTLKDKLLELVHKKPGETTDMQDANSLSSAKQSFQSSALLQETDSGQRNHQTSTDGECPPNGEGLKLDLLILQKQVELNTKLLRMENIQKQDENALGVEFFDYKKRCEKLLSTMEEKCLFFESRALSLEQEMIL